MAEIPCRNQSSYSNRLKTCLIVLQIMYNILCIKSCFGKAFIVSSKKFKKTLKNQLCALDDLPLNTRDLTDSLLFRVIMMQIVIYPRVRNYPLINTSCDFSII